MKKGYKRLLIFQIVIFLLLLVNSFIWNILRTYNIVFFLIGVLVAFKFLFGFEKDRNRYAKDAIMELFIILLFSFLLYYLSGLIIGFSRVNNYYTLNGMTTFVLPIIFSTIIKEYLRYNMLQKSEGSKLLLITTCLLFIAFDLTNILDVANFKTAYSTFIFIALTVLPNISNNITATYISSKFGYKPNLVWLLVIRLYYYLLPIVPATGEYITSLISLIYPIIILMIMNNLAHKMEDEHIERDYKKIKWIPIAITSFVILALVYFTTGYFHYYAVAIGSGSMYPKIHKGDVVIITKLNPDDELKVGDIIAYQKEKIMIVHRVIEIEKDKNEYFYYTKGDANEDVDDWIIKRKDIIGKINHRIPYAGLPTVWLSELSK